MMDFRSLISKSGVITISLSLGLILFSGCDNEAKSARVKGSGQNVSLKIGLPSTPNSQCHAKEQVVSIEFAESVSEAEFKLAIWASTLAYFPEELVLKQAKASGFESVKFIDMSKATGPLQSGFQAFVAQLPGLSVVGIRGSSEGIDWTGANFKDIPKAGESVQLPGRVHTGFESQLSSGWDEVIAALGKGSDPIIITGHSLGGALTTLFAGRLSALGYPVARAISFAAPKSGDDVYGEGLHRALGLKLIRAIKTDDLVPQTPAGATFASIVAQIDKLGENQNEIDKRTAFLQEAKYTHAGVLYTLNVAEGKFLQSAEPSEEINKAWLTKILELKKQAKNTNEEEFKKVNAELDAPHGVGNYACPILADKVTKNPQASVEN
jgi:thioesterase domain-containing protein